MASKVRIPWGPGGRIIISFSLALPLALGVGTAFAILFGNPGYLLAMLLSWSLYFTVLGIMASFIYDDLNPSLASLVFMTILIFIASLYRWFFFIPVNVAYVVEYYLVVKTLREVTSNKV